MYIYTAHGVNGKVYLTFGRDYIGQIVGILELCG